MITAGAGGSGKTRLWQAMATAFATGRPCLGPYLAVSAFHHNALVWTYEVYRIARAANLTRVGGIGLPARCQHLATNYVL